MGQSRRKRSVDLKRCKVEFNVGDHIFLELSPMKVVTRFNTRGQLSPRYVRPFLILKKIGIIA